MVYRPGECRLHSEARPFPVAGSPQALELIQDNTPVFFFPLESIAQKFFASDIRFPQALLPEQGHHLSLGSNGSVVCAGYPACVFPLQPCFSDQDILDRIVQHVPHVQYARHVWWGDNNSEWLPPVGHGMKIPPAHPVPVPSFFSFLRVIPRA